MLSKLLTACLILACSMSAQAAENLNDRIDLDDVIAQITQNLPSGAIYHFDHIETKVKKADSDEEEVIGYIDGFYDSENKKFLNSKSDF